MKYVIFSIFALFILFINLLMINDFYLFDTTIFTLPPNIYKYCSIIIYFITIIPIFIILKNNYYSLSTLDKKFKNIIIVNILLYTLYNIFTFKLISPFLSFAIKTFQFVSSLYLNEEIIFQNKISAKLLSPYILWCFYLTLISISNFFLNNS